jgi:nitroreductase
LSKARVLAHCVSRCAAGWRVFFAACGQNALHKGISAFTGRAGPRDAPSEGGQGQTERRFPSHQKGVPQMELFEAIRARASVRSLKPVELPEEDLVQILDAGRRAASGRNVQPFGFIVVRDADTIRQLSAAQACIADVGLAIGVVADPDGSKYWLEDISAATENMLLAVTALGYATVWIEGTLLRREDEFKQLLGIPANMRFMVLLPIGKAAGEASQAAKKPLEEIVHWEKYGQ